MQYFNAVLQWNSEEHIGANVFQPAHLHWVNSSRAQYYISLLSGITIRSSSRLTCTGSTLANNKLFSAQPSRSHQVQVQVAPLLPITLSSSPSPLTAVSLKL